MSNMEATGGSGATPLEVRRLEGFDLPAYWVPADQPATGGLVFHVGRGLEPAALAGITHLIRHLAAQSLDFPAHGPYDPPGVDVTGFSYQGSPKEVADYLHAISARLTVIPLDELAEAKGALTEEANGWKPTIREQLFRLRHGSVGLGALTFPEYAVRKAGHIQLNAWAGSSFHTGNAAVWFSGPEPAPTQLRLVRGTSSYPDQPLLEIPTPGSVYGSPGEVALSQIAPRTHVALAGFHVARIRATQTLVREGGPASELTFSVERIDNDVVELVVIAKCERGREDDLARELLAVFDELGSNKPTLEEIDEYRNTTALTFFDHNNAASIAAAHAVGRVTGVSALSWPETYAELNALTADAISSTMIEALQTSLVVAPRDTKSVDKWFEYVGNWSPNPVAGAKVKAVRVKGEGLRVNRDLWFGPKGITIREGDRLASVLFSQCVLLLRGENGYRELISESGGRVVFLANAWHHGAAIASAIDKEVLPERTLLLETSDRRQGYVGAERRRWER